MRHSLQFTAYMNWKHGMYAYTPLNWCCGPTWPWAAVHWEEDLPSPQLELAQVPQWTQASHSCGQALDSPSQAALTSIAWTVCMHSPWPCQWNGKRVFSTICWFCEEYGIAKSTVFFNQLVRPVHSTHVGIVLGNSILWNSGYNMRESD